MSAIPSTLDELRVPLDSLKPYRQNPRRGATPEIIKSLKRLGQYRPLVVNRGTLTGRSNEILAGNHTHKAAKALGWSDIAATFVDVDDDTAARIVAVDNRTNDLAAYDDSELTDLLRGLSDLEGTGFTDRDLAEMLTGSSETPGRTTETGRKPKRPRAKPGDLYVLNEHRIVCAEPDDQAQVLRVLDGRRADLLFTDPGGVIDLTVAAATVARTGAWYVWCTWRTLAEVSDALNDVGRRPTSCIVWAKGSATGAGPYRSQHDFCLMCRPAAVADHELCIYCKADDWQGNRGQTDLWEAPRVPGGDEKPVELAETAIANSSRPAEVVLDLFGRTGSTLLAAENLNRRAAIVEADPGNVDLMVDRWERHTGQKAIRHQ